MTVGAGADPIRTATEHSPRPLPFSGFPPADLAAVEFVLTDIDDTLTSDGRLPAIAYAALERLQAAGLAVIPITGRPAGWCDLIARLWPVDAVIGENGAFYFRADPQRGMLRVFQTPDEQRHAHRTRLRALSQAILEAVPGARIAADQPFRETDLAIDFAEDGPLLAEADIERILACFHAAGATAKVSSIHVNGWYGSYDKLAMTRRLFTEVFGRDIGTINRQVVFVGDSPNDEPLFGFFGNAVAVANFAAFAHRVERQPRWITAAPGGRGFAEVADALIGARQGR